MSMSITAVWWNESGVIDIGSGDTMTILAGGGGGPYSRLCPRSCIRTACDDIACRKYGCQYNETPKQQAEKVPPPRNRHERRRYAALSRRA